MPVLDLTTSRALVVRVVEELFAKRHSPVPGALVKAQVVMEATASGSTFEERQLGYRNFLHFVKETPDIAIQIRPGSDVLLAPRVAADILSAYAHPLPRLRRDFWRAFIEFPVPNTLRLYDPLEDKVFYENIPTSRKGIPIDPVPRQDQVAWRRSFAEEQAEPTRGTLLSSLNGFGSSVFNEFARRLRENPSLMQLWNRYLQKKITDYVTAWAIANNVAEERWSSGTSRSDEGSSKVAMPEKTYSVSQRSELYNFFDNLPIEDLLQLRVPLDWVLKVTREKK